ncbi:chaperone NapD [uncultured Ruegeria sp.]|jgi:nitrate reductase NapD|uniref:chaperone NapD n=1 Tax=uncultured Ruegeria sp. TaxID=259304 RepID=UPI00260D952C|nr:chaperone NapD [uncultured Ruegeria sp.]
MNICGCLIHVAPHSVQDAAETIGTTPGVEIHARDEGGRFVVVVEDTSDRLASETIMDLHQIDGVVSLTLTYHHFEDLSAAT